MAVAIMSLLLITVGAIFAMSTKATGLANANNEVMNNLRAFEQQIRNDLRGIRKDAFLGLCYNYLPPRQVAPGRPESAAVRSDWIVFFANGDFQTINQRWDPTSTPPSFAGLNAVPIRSNLARVAYGMMGVLNNGVTGNANASRPLAQVELGRCAKLMVSDLYPGTGAAQLADDPPGYAAFVAVTSPFMDTSGNPQAPANLSYLHDKAGDVFENWEYEYTTLADFRNPFARPAVPLTGVPVSYSTHLVGRYPGSGLRNNLWLGLAYIDVNEAIADHLRMIPGCISFKIQRWAETNPVNRSAPWIPRWWPEDNDDNDEDNNPLPSGTAPLAPFPGAPPANSAGFGPAEPVQQTWEGMLMWECFNAPSVALHVLDQVPTPDDWPQGMGHVPPWPWIIRDFDRVTATPPDMRRAVSAAFPKALKITITVMDANRRMLEKVPARQAIYDDANLTLLGAQTFSMIIPLE